MDLRVLCLGFGIQGLWCWVQRLELEVQGVEFRHKTVGNSVKGLGKRCWWCGFRCKEIDCRVQGGLVEHRVQRLDWRGGEGSVSKGFRGSGCGFRG